MVMSLSRRRWTLVLIMLAFLAPFSQISTASPSTGTTSRPNVLIIVTDDQRGGLSVMPETRRWMKRGGTRFNNAFVTTPICCPSRSSIFTGRYTHNHHVYGNSGQAINLNQQTTLQYYLKQAGYETAMYGKYLNDWDITQPPPYFDHYSMTIRSHSYRDGVWNVNGQVQTLPDYNVSYISRRAKHFISSAGTQQPWFLYLATAAPHSPFTPQPKYADAAISRWAGDPAVFERNLSDKPPYVQRSHAGIHYGRRTRKAQFRTLKSVDDLVSNVFTTLRNLGEAKNTLVFFISDNGLMWGEHGLTHKGVPYDQSIRVPFLVRWPGHFLRHAKDSRIVANIDIAPTVLQATGVTPNPAYPIDGRTLLGTDSHRQRLLTEYFIGTEFRGSPQGMWASTRTDTYQYTEYYGADGSTVVFREYYNLRKDPWELHNLLGDATTLNDPNVAALHLQLAQDRVCVGTVGANACP
jgi:arylsulfatase A-like enzyme